MIIITNDRNIHQFPFWHRTLRQLSERVFEVDDVGVDGLSPIQVKAS